MHLKSAGKVYLESQLSTRESSGLFAERLASMLIEMHGFRTHDRPPSRCIAESSTGCFLFSFVQLFSAWITFRAPNPNSSSIADGECYCADLMNLFVRTIDRNIRRPVLGLGA